jgi:hypothetical protein
LQRQLRKRQKRASRKRRKIKTFSQTPHARRGPAADSNKTPPREKSMKRPIVIGATVASAAVMIASLPLLAAEPETWPWKSKLPPNPALVQLSSIESVSVVINKSDPPTVAITVNASAPSPGFSEFQLAPRMGDPKDLAFSFDAKGRPSQDMTKQEITPVSFTIEYKDAPIEKVGVVEVYGQGNCKAFSVTDNKETECKATSIPQ